MEVSLSNAAAAPPVPTASVNHAQTGASMKSNELGMSRL